MLKVHSPERPTLFALDQLSDEQRRVVSAVVVDRCNVIVNAVAGSGKTRTALVTSMEWVCSRHASHDVSVNEKLDHFSKNSCITGFATPMVLLVAYNRLLMEDMVSQRNARVPPHLRSLIEVRTIHGLGRQYFGGEGITTDRDLYRWMEDKTSPFRQFPPYSLVIIDEAQDLNPILFNFLRYVLSYLNHPQLLILGDPFQLLYRFNGADERFLIEANERFAEVAAPVPFKRFKLSICFRITHEMANWINIFLNPNNLDRAAGPNSWHFEDYRQQIADWWGDGIKANPGRPPAPDSVTFCDGSALPYPRVDRIVGEMTGLLQQYDASSFVLLSPSLSNEKSPARLITNNLSTVSEMKQSWFIDIGNTQDDGNFLHLRRNKRIASTIHKFKGRECDAVALIGFDGFFESKGISDPRDLFNVFYVAATRARERLHIVQWDRTPFATLRRQNSTLSSSPLVDSPCLVTRALEYCGYDPILCEESSSCLTVRTAHSRRAYVLSSNEYTVPGSHHAHKQNTLENVSAVIGVAVEIRLQLILDNGKLRVPPLSGLNTGDYEDCIDEDLRKYLLELRSQAPSRIHYSWTDLMKIATAYLTLGDRFFSRWRQVRNFSDWAIVRAPEKLDQIIRNLVHLLFIPFCAEDLKGEWDISLGSGLSQVESAMLQTVDDVPYEQKVDALKKLRREGRILFHGVLDFWMGANKAFVGKYGHALTGEMDITLISREIMERWKRARKYRAAQAAVSWKYPTFLKHFRNCYGQGDGVSSEVYVPQAEMAQINNAARDAINRVETDDGRNDNLHLGELTRLSRDGGDITIIEVKVTSKTDHNHVLQLGCYGSIWREASRWIKSGCTTQKPEFYSMNDDEICNAALDVSKTNESTQKATQEAREPPKMPRMFLAYPNLGLLRQVQLGMNSEEYLHRIGCRKANSPFDPSVLGQLMPSLRK